MHTPTHRESVRLVLASGNPHKIDELRAIFAAARLNGVQLLGLGDFHTLVPLREPAETGATFDENATIKAKFYAMQLGLPALADDSGLEIDALGGKPGVISSHYCTDGRDEGMTREHRDAANNARVLRELDGVERGRRAARFVCVMKLAVPTASGGEPSIVASSRGTFEGAIGVPPDVPRGKGGFGYDPLFLVASEHRLSSSELPAETKNALSHRGHAARAMAGEIARLVAAGKLR